MTPASREISSGLVGPTQSVDECRASSLENRLRSGSTGIRLIEELVENSDDSNFDEFEDSDEGPNLGLRRCPDLYSIIYTLDMRDW